MKTIERLKGPKLHQMLVEDIRNSASLDDEWQKNVEEILISQQWADYIHDDLTQFDKIVDAWKTIEDQDISKSVAYLISSYLITWDEHLLLNKMIEAQGQEMFVPSAEDYLCDAYQLNAPKCMNTIVHWVVQWDDGTDHLSNYAWRMLNAVCGNVMASTRHLGDMIKSLAPLAGRHDVTQALQSLADLGRTDEMRILLDSQPLIEKSIEFLANIIKISDDDAFEVAQHYFTAAQWKEARALALQAPHALSSNPVLTQVDVMISKEDLHQEMASAIDSAKTHSRPLKL